LISRSYDVNNLTSAWDKYYMTGRKERLENDVSFFDLDFESID